NPRDPYGVDPRVPDTIWHCSYVLFPRYGQWRLIPVPDPNRPGQFLQNRFFILNTFSGKVMDVPRFATGVCNIQQFGRNNGTNQQWQLEPVSKWVGPIIVTNYRIRSVSSGLVLDVPGFATGDVEVQQFGAKTTGDLRNQLWRLEFIGR